MNKTGKITRVQCQCKLRFNRTTGEWYQPTEQQTELDKNLTAQGHLIVKHEMCPECRKAGGCK